MSTAMTLTQINVRISKNERESVMYGEELPIRDKFPPRLWCKYPYRKCRVCSHETPCVPDYGDLYRKKLGEYERPLTYGEALFCLVFWVIIAYIGACFISLWF